MLRGMDPTHVFMTDNGVPLTKSLDELDRYVLALLLRAAFSSLRREGA
jgi:hypothetical protein